MNKEQFYIVGGKHTVTECIKNPSRMVKTIYINNEKYLDVVEKINKKNTKIEIKSPKAFNKLFKDKEFTHQGFAALIHPLPTLEFDKFVSNFLSKKTDSILIILDGIEDDRNIGSIIRSSSALGADAILINKREFRNQSIYLHKAASGSTEHIPIFPLPNVLHAIQILKKNKFWIYALDGQGNDSIFNEQFDNKSALIFGSENSGTRKIVLNNSDKILFIPMKKEVDSLNVSNAVAASLSIYNSQKQKKSPQN